MPLFFYSCGTAKIADIVRLTFGVFGIIIEVSKEGLIMTSVSTKEIVKDKKYSIIVYGDYRHIANNSIIDVRFDCSLYRDGSYQVSRVYYNSKKDESTILIKR